MNTVEQAHYFGSSGFYGTVTAVFRCVGGGSLLLQMFIAFPICRTNPETDDEEEDTESVDNWEVEDADRIIEAR